MTKEMKSPGFQGLAVLFAAAAIGGVILAATVALAPAGVIVTWTLAGAGGGVAGAGTALCGLCLYYDWDLRKAEVKRSWRS